MEHRIKWWREGLPEFEVFKLVDYQNGGDGHLLPVIPVLYIIYLELSSLKYYTGHVRSSTREAEGWDGGRNPKLFAYSKILLEIILRLGLSPWTRLHKTLDWKGLYMTEE